MTLRELYAGIPVARHRDIIVDSPHVWVKDANGDLTHFFILADGSLWLVPADVTLSLAKKVLDQAQTAITAIKSDVSTIKTQVAAIKAKVGA